MNDLDLFRYIHNQLQHAKAPIPDGWANAYDALSIALAADVDDDHGLVPVANEAATVAPDQVLDLITRAADAEARAPKYRDAQRQVVTALTRRCWSELGHVAPAVIASMAKPFDKAAAAFTQAATKLPRDLSDTGLVNAGSEALAAFRAAEAAASDMDALAHVRNELAYDAGVRCPINPPGHPVARGLEHATRYWHVESWDAIEDEMNRAARDGKSRLHPWLDTLAAPGFGDLRWRTLDEQREALAAIAIPEGVIPKPKKEQQRVTIGMMGRVG